MTKASDLPCRWSDVDPDWWFAWPGSANAGRAQNLCYTECPLWKECQTLALEEGIPYGIWGGMDEEQRAREWARRPEGRPSKFLDAIDTNVRPLLQARRDQEQLWDEEATP